MVMSLILLVASTLSVTAARADLVRAAKARKNMTTMKADYVQRRTTMLSKKPLTASGTLYYRAKPATATLHVKKPRASVIRLSPKLYEVYRPKQDTLERFELKSNTWSNLLTKTMSAQVDTLEEHFVIVSSTLGKAPQKMRTIVLRPRKKKLAGKVTRLELVIDTNKYLVHRVSFDDRSGDRVSFELRNHKLNSKLAKSVFAIPKSNKTRVITHR